MLSGIGQNGLNGPHLSFILTETGHDIIERKHLRKNRWETNRFGCDGSQGANCRCLKKVELSTSLISTLRNAL